MPGKIDNPYNNVSKAIAARTIERLKDGESRSFFGPWLKKRKDLYNAATGEFYTQEKQKAKLIIVFAGVGAGKTNFFIEELRKHGTVFFNCSRTLIKYQQVNRSSDEGNELKDLFIHTSWDLDNPNVFSKAMGADYLVVDEFHHLFSDSFCDAPNYVYELLQYSRPEQTIILMSACVDYISSAFFYIDRHLEYIKKVYDKDQDWVVIESLRNALQLIYDEHSKNVDLNKPTGSEILKSIPLFNWPVCVIDVMNCCHNLHPKDIKIIDQNQLNELFENSQDDNSKHIYYCYSAKKAYKLACDFTIKGKRVVAITSSNHYLRPILDRTISDIIIESMNDSDAKIEDQREIINNLYALAKKEENAIDELNDGRFPTDIDILFTTSRMREGVNIELSSETASAFRLNVFSENTDNVNLVQTVGRVRRYREDDINIDLLYAIVGIDKKRVFNGLDDFPDQECQYKGVDEFIDKQLIITFFRCLFSKWLPNCYAYDIPQDAHDTFSVRIVTDDQGEPIDVIENTVSVDEKPARSWTQQRKAAQKIQLRINNFLGNPGKIFMRPVRNFEKNYIERFSIEVNHLWRVNYNAMNDETNETVDCYNAASLARYQRKLQHLFPSSIVTNDVACVDLEAVVTVIRKYIGRYLGKEDSKLLKQELVALHFISPTGYIWHKIKKIKVHFPEYCRDSQPLFSVKEKDTKRACYIIIENAINSPDDGSEGYYSAD